MSGINYISYSGYKTYTTCPFEYWNKYPNKTPLPSPDDGLGSLYGSVVGLVYEAFYRDSLWKSADCLGAMQELVRPYLKKAMVDQRRQGRYFNWNSPTALYHNEAELVQDIMETLPRGLQVIRENRLMGPVMQAELKLDQRYGKYTIGGRADFVIRRVPPFNDLCIMDGKGSRHRDKYVDGHPKKEGAEVEGVQLKWYGFLYQDKFSHLPDRLGYIFWKFRGKKAIEWVNFSQESLTSLKQGVLSTIARIDSSVVRIEELNDQPQARDELRQELFPAQPSHQCTLCPYSTICEDGKKKTRSYQRESPNLPSGVDDFTL